MNEQQFMDWNAQANKKELKLSRHEEFVRSLLSKQQDFSAAQIHDRLLELEPDLLVIPLYFLVQELDSYLTLE